MTPHIHTGHCDNCEAQAKTIKQLEDHIAVIRGAMVKGEPIGAVKALQADKALLRKALQRIARYDVGLQALIEDGADTPENRAKYYEGRVEYRRIIARTALQETVDDAPNLS